jgi:hypothetical protein
MKTLYSYQTNIIQLSEKRSYHAVVILTNKDNGLEAKIILESDFSNDEILVGTYFSSTYDYVECNSYVYSMLNDLSYLDDIWMRFINKRTLGGSNGKFTYKKRNSHN